jgi:hydrogenase/urease accessory protein HupE
MRALLALTLALAPTAALAHTGHGTTEGPLHGLDHPVGSPENLFAFAMIAFLVAGGVLLVLSLVRKGRQKS